MMTDNEARDPMRYSTEKHPNLTLQGFDSFRDVIAGTERHYLEHRQRDMGE